jgi:hypothetical protein
MARAYFIGRFGLNDLCVNSRWKPIEMPCPAMV